MNHLKSTLSSCPDFASLRLPAQPRKLREAGDNISVLLGQSSAREPSPYDLEETYRAISATEPSSSALQQLPSKHLKRAPWVLFQPREEGPALAQIPGMLDAYLDALAARHSAPAILNLALVFLRDYPQREPYFDQVRSFIQHAIKHLHTPRGKRLQARSDAYHLFVPNGADTFGKTLIARNSPAEFMVRAGFESGLQERGFIKAAAARSMRVVNLLLKTGSMELERLEGLLSFYAHNPTDKRLMRFPELRKELAEALLKPFLEKSPASYEEQKLLREFFIDHYGDPRLGKANWQGISEETVGVLLRWLVHTTLEQFFHLVTQSSKEDPDADRMWPYRRAFWTAYLKKQVITDAWVVLGEKIQWSSREFLKENRGTYGKLARGYGANQRHAILILRIDDLVITEFSHSGKYRVWHHDNRNAPKFYRSEKPYTRDELTLLPDFEGSHHGAPAGNWQANLSQLIREWTDISMTKQEYMPGE